MDFTNEFRVNLPVDQAWALLTDVERIAPCMPGAQLTGVDGDAYNGVVKVKVGPMTVQYKGAVSFEEKDDDGHTAILHARGRDARGQGNADARVTARLAADGDGTRVGVDTRLTITGKIAQLGKGMIEEVSGKLLTQFVDNLEEQLAAERQQGGEPTMTTPAPEPGGGSGPAPEAVSAGTTREATTAAPTSNGVRPTEAPSAAAPTEPEALDLMSVARGAVLKRALPAVIVLAVVVIVLLVWLI